MRVTQFLVLAYDGSDEDASARRRAARPAHFDEIGPRVERKEVLAAGAILDDGGSMIGSVLLVEFPSRTELDGWLSCDPYVTRGVWQSIEVRPFRLAVLDGKVTP
jgi:uncharacterized protein